jgi:hypothetical protein
MSVAIRLARVEPRVAAAVLFAGFDRMVGGYRHA